jgi:hypothetical protein
MPINNNVCVMGSLINRSFFGMKPEEIVISKFRRFFPLLAGARVKPNAIADPEMAEMLKKDYHFFACLAYIHQGRHCPSSLL